MAGQPLNATFFAFKKRDRGGVLLGASAAYLIIAIVLLAAFVALNYQGVIAIAQWYGSLLSASAQGKSPAAAMASIPAGIGIFVLTLIPFMFAFYILLAAYEAACLRWMIRGERGGFMGLSLGADTWRVYLTYWIWFGLYMAFSTVFTLLTFLAMGISLSTGASGDQAAAAFLPAVLAVTVLRLVLMLYFGLRLAPAAATSVGRQRFAFFDAWKVTKGRFWAMLGSFLIVVLIAFVGEIVFVGIIFAIIGANVLPQIMSAGANPSDAQVSAIFGSIFTAQNAVVLGVAYAILLALSLIIYVLFFGINARAVIAAAEDGKIDGVPSAAVANTFS